MQYSRIHTEIIGETKLDNIQNAYVKATDLKVNLSEKQIRIAIIIINFTKDIISLL